MSNKSNYHQKLRKEHLPIIQSFCEDAGLEYEFIYGFKWHIRIEKVLDVFPTHNKWHWLPTGERGRFSDYEELGQIFNDRMSDE